MDWNRLSLRARTRAAPATIGHRCEQPAAHQDDAGSLEVYGGLALDVVHLHPGPNRSRSVVECEGRRGEGGEDGDGMTRGTCDRDHDDQVVEDGGLVRL